MSTSLKIDIINLPGGRHFGIDFLKIATIANLKRSLIICKKKTSAEDENLVLLTSKIKKGNSPLQTNTFKISPIRIYGQNTQQKHFGFNPRSPTKNNNLKQSQICKTQSGNFKINTPFFLCQKQPTLLYLGKKDGKEK